MSTNSKERARRRTQMLAELRKQHSQQVKQAQELLKGQQAVRKSLLRALEGGPRTVPQLAGEAGIPAHEVLRVVATMKKYGLVEEIGLDEEDEYYLYGLPKEAER
jgi:predicted Rossmann fold nucleotide-binding protein DprA/Smf involved in DNA uptake